MAKKQTSAFNKMLALYNDELPDISSSNYGDIASEGADEVDVVNRAIDDTIKDQQNSATRLIELARHHQNVKNKKLQQFGNLLVQAKPIKEWVEKDIEARREFRRYEEGARVKQATDQEGVKVWTTDQDVDDLGFFIADKRDRYGKVEDDQTDNLEEGLKQVDALVERQLKGEKLSQKDRILIQSPTTATVDNQSAYEDKKDVIEGANSATFTQLLSEGLYIDDPTIPEELQGLSWMDLNNGSADMQMFKQKWEEAIYGIYMAGNGRKIDRIGNRVYRRQVVPEVIKALNLAVSQQEGVRAQQITTEYKDNKYIKYSNAFSSSMLTDPGNPYGTSMDTFFGEGGQLSQFGYTGPDSPRDTNAPFEEFEKFFLWAAENPSKSGINGIQLSEMLEDEFPQKGTDGKATTLEKLKPQLYKKLKRIAQVRVATDADEDIRIRKGEVQAGVSSFITKQNELRKKDPLGYILTSDKVQEEINRLSNQYGVSQDDTLFNPLKNLLTEQDKDQQNALLELAAAWAIPNAPLPTEAIEILDDQKEKQKWTARAKIRGETGLGVEDKDYVETALTEVIKSKLNLDATVTYETIPLRQRSALGRAEKLFYQKYKEYMKVNPKGVPFEDFKSNAIQQALLYVEENPDQWETGDRPELPTKPALTNVNNTVNYIKRNKKTSLTQDNYISVAEESAILKANDFFETGKGEFPYYFYQYAGYYKVNGKKLTPLQYYEVRKGATSELREEGEDSGKELKYSVLSVDPTDYNDVDADIEWVVDDNHIDQTLTWIQNPNLTVDTVQGDPSFSDQPVSGLNIADILRLEGEGSGNVKLGVYGLTYKDIWYGIDNNVIDPNTVFDEETQRVLKTVQIIKRINAKGSSKVIDNSFRNNRYLSKFEKEEIKKIWTAIDGDDRFNLQYWQLNLLSAPVVTELLNRTE